MQVEFEPGEIEKLRTPLVALLLAEEDSLRDKALARLDAECDGMLDAIRRSGDFLGRLWSQVLVYNPKPTGPRRILLLGLGKRALVNTERLRQAAARVVRRVGEVGIPEVSLHYPLHGNLEAIAAQAFTEGAILGDYRYDRYVSPREGAPKRVEKLVLHASGPNARTTLGTAITRGSILGDVVCGVRDLVNAPANEVTPTEMADRASASAQKYGYRAEVLDKRAMARLGMGGLLAVSKGSEQPPRFIVLEHDGADRRAAPYLVVGKGLTFDAGGLCIKPALKMDEMKGDMAGGAAVLGILEAAARLRLPERVVGLVPATENLLGGAAYRPGDILRMLGGKTVHVDNTDAEGRLIIADALAYGQRYRPRAVVDLATLTGAVLIALGQVATAALGNDRALVQKLAAAGERCFERLWEMPLWEEFEDFIKSPIADLKNTGGKNGGTITAAAFLKQFVGSSPWVHLDIAGTAYLDKADGYRPQGATGVGVRLLIEFLQAESAARGRRAPSRRGRR